MRQRLARPAALGGDDVARLIAALAPDAHRPAERLTWLRCSLGETIRLVKVADVLYLESDSKYTRVVTRDGEGLVRIPLKELLDGLDPDAFWQVHRGTIVNADAVDRVVRDGPERLRLHLKGHRDELVVSRAYTHRFRRD